MSAGRRDLVVILLAVAGLIGAISLAGIFVVYLVDTIGDDGSKSSQTAATTGPSAPGGANTGDGSAPGLPGGTPPANRNGSPSGTSGPGPGLNVIPRDQQYATYRNRAQGYSILYPKDWVRLGSGRDVKFTRNNNFLRIKVNPGKPPTVAEIRRNLRRNKAVTLPGGSGNPGVVTINGRRVIKDTVIQKAVLQQTPQGPIRSVIDQYRFARGGKVAVVDLGTTTRVRPRNLDEFKKIAESFRFR